MKNDAAFILNAQSRAKAHCSRVVRALLYFIAPLCLVAGCGGGGSSNRNGPGSSSTQSNQPPADSITVNPTSLTITNNSSQNNFSVSGGSGSLIESNNCLNIALLEGPPPTDAAGAWSVIPEQNGTCAATFTDGTASATLAITVNIPSGTSTLTWPVSLDASCQYTVYLKFFDKTDNLVWPGPQQTYVLNQTGTVYAQPLSCQTGAQVCYGAALSQTTDTPYYWGVGITGNEGCTNCCYSCTTTTVPQTTLSCANVSGRMQKEEEGNK